ncbi:hypothetical protein [Amycolatopsis anabasis]|nr:hypothetical protein [Amycolatopsis anabasis]
MAVAQDPSIPDNVAKLLDRDCALEAGFTWINGSSRHFPNVL